MSAISEQRTILITGANRGIGYCILKRLLRAFPGHRYLLGARDTAAAEAALDNLRSEGVLKDAHRVTVLQLDVTSTKSIASATETIRNDFNGQLDVLVNNAGIAVLPTDDSDLETLQDNWSQTLLVNVVAPHLIFQAFLPFLIKSSTPRVINVSSGRASLQRSSTRTLPPTAVVSYSVSKVALNGLGVEMEKVLTKQSGGKGRVWSANPGHCKTAFNNYRGTRDPLDGAGVVEVLLKGDANEEPVESGFWEEEDGLLARVPW